MMDAQLLEGGFTNAPVDAAHAFRAAMNAMARPGRIEAIAGGQGPAPMSAAAATLILTLCDPETPLHLAGPLDNEAVRAWVTFHTGAPLVGAGEAVFALGHWDDLMPIDHFAIGTSEYPDRSATLIVECDGLRAEGAQLRGPGIKDVAALNLPDPDVFRANHALFPLGRDFFFTSGSDLAALPRSTEVN